MKLIAITGNIASGKSLVLDYIAAKGYLTLCLDEVTKTLYKTSPDFKSKLVENFSTSDKAQIAQIVFTDKEKLLLLNKITHPFIKARMEDFIANNSASDYIFIAAPLLFEADLQGRFDKILFVSSNENLRLSRLKKRNNLSDIEAKQRIEAQAGEAFKIAQSDYVIENNGTVEVLYKKVDSWLKELSKPL